MHSRAPFVILGVSVGLLFNVGLALAWTGPTATAPGSNIAAPLNVGTTGQIKSGDLTTNSHTVYGDILLNYGWNPAPSTITYLNFSDGQMARSPIYSLNSLHNTHTVPGRRGTLSVLAIHDIIPQYAEFNRTYPHLFS